MKARKLNLGEAEAPPIPKRHPKLKTWAKAACWAAAVCYVLNLVQPVDQIELPMPGELEVVKFEWKKFGFGVMEATIAIRNTGDRDIKDIKILAAHFAPSGTIIDSNTRTIYEVIKAGETRIFEKFNMGFIHSQATGSKLLIESATYAHP